MSAKSIKALEKVLKKKIVDDFEEGTVIRWVSSGRIDYSYAAIKAGGKWWLTGVANYYGGKVFDYEGLVKILTGGSVKDIKVSESWIDVF